MPNEEVKLKNAAIVAFLAFLASVITYSLFFGPAKKLADSLTPARIIWVSAEGKTFVSPDIAAVSFSVVSEGKDPKLLADENSRKMEAAINAVKASGVDAKDIKTVQYSLSPRYEYDEASKKTFISGYTLTQTVSVKIRNLDRVAAVLGELPGAGINQIGQVSFSIDDPEKYLAEARQKAFERVKIKAETMAVQNGVRLKKVLNFSEYYGGIPGPRFYEAGLGGKGGGEFPVLPPIQPGQEEITVSVSVQYEIK